MARWMDDSEGWEAAKNRVMTRSNSTVNKVFVALPGEWKAGKSVLDWALKNSPENSVIVITHVLVQTSHTNLASIYTSMNLERKRTDRQLDKYTDACARLKFRAEKLVFEADSIAEGLLNLITLHGITTLVMGAAQNKNYTMNMEQPKSKKAIEVRQKADPSCKILFVCKEDLICTREATSMASPVDAPSLERSKLLYLSQQLKSLPSVKQCFKSPKPQPKYRSFDPSEDNLTRTQIKQNELEMHSDSDSSSSTDIKIEAQYSSYEINMNLLSSSSSKTSMLANGGMRSDDQNGCDRTFAKLQDALIKAETLKNEVRAEHNRCRRTEQELSLAIIETERLDGLHRKNLKEREEIEEKLANLDRHTKDIEKKLAETQFLLSSLQDDHDRLLKEHETAVKEADSLRHGRSKMNFSGSFLEPNCEFSYAELMQATQGFNDLLKIKEDEFGPAYIGTILDAFVCVKLLHSSCVSDRLQYKQEVTVLSTLRHPNVATLIGSCQDAPALVYEHVPRSLQEHLVSLDSGLALTWQLRTRIIGEICCALIFLHSSKPHAIIHGNLRPETVLIDSDMHVKLSDYGTTFLKSTEYLRNSYFDPDTLVSRRLSCKSDIYSFGMIVLHLLTGRSSLAITGAVEEALAKGELGSVLDAQ